MVLGQQVQSADNGKGSVVEVIKNYTNTVSIKIGAYDGSD